MASNGEFPSSWTETNLGNISEVRRGASPRPIGDPKWFSDEGPGWVRIVDVTRSRRYLRQTVQALSEEGAKRSVRVHPGDVIMSICASIGFPVIVDMEACIHDGFVLFDKLADEVDREYLCYFLDQESERFARQGQKGTQGNLNTTIVKETIFPKPPIGEQRKIVEILNATDYAIEATRGVIDQTRRLKTALLQDLLTNGLPGRHKKFKTVRGLGRIPSDWKVERLDKFSTVARGKFTHRPRNDPRFYGGDVPFVQTGDVVGSGDYLREHSQTLNERGLSVSRMFPKGTILFTIAASVGACTISSYDVAFPDSIVGINPHDHVELLFLLRVLRESRSRIIKTATESAQANISLELLCPIEFAVPTLEEQQSISKVLRAVEERIESNNEHLQQLIALKAALSQGLLTGRIRVIAGSDA